MSAHLETAGYKPDNMVWGFGDRGLSFQIPVLKHPGIQFTVDKASLNEVSQILKFIKVFFSSGLRRHHHARMQFKS